MKRRAFTLSEVLITLVIIGVISAITIPALIQSTQKKELETAFKKQYSVLKQAISMLKLNDCLEFAYDNYKSGFKKKLAAQFNVINDCGSSSSSLCILNEDNTTIGTYKSYSNGTLSKGYLDDGGFVTTDGSLYLIEQGSQARDLIGNFLVTVDVNGYSKKPNKMGYDMFMFQITEDGEVLPMGAKNTYFESNRENYCSKSSGSSYNGYTCAYYAAANKDYFGKL